MRLLVDTQLLLWAAAEPHRVPDQAAGLMEAEDNELHFSVVSLWETTIKNGLGRPDFQVDARRLRGRLLESGYREVTVGAEHALFMLPRFHGDPFDRMLVAQAAVEQLTVLTVDATLARYGDHAAIHLA
ncbi:MAG: type II toxin-antitoxin system VapC family toxin [Rhizobiaceae bacterium]